MNILNLEGWDVLQLEDRNGEYYVTAQPSTANHASSRFVPLRGSERVIGRVRHRRTSFGNWSGNDPLPYCVTLSTVL